MRSWLILPLLLSGCFLVTSPPGKFSCDTDGDCPAGLVCKRIEAGLRCVATVDAAMAPPPADLSLPPPPPDLTPVDLVRPPDLSPFGPCLADGIHLGPGAWACKGDFAAGGAATLCRDPGYHVCETADGVVLEKWPACEQEIGFYASQVRIERVEDAGAANYSVGCNVGAMPAPPTGLLGCGKETGTKGVQVVAGTCPRLATALRCDRGTTWTCTGALAQAAHRGAETGGGGVLCCRNR